MAQTYVVNYAAIREVAFPFSGAGANVPAGTLVIPGVTGGTNIGVLIPATASSNTDCLGVLNENHTFAASGDATTATLVQWFPANSGDSGSFALGTKLAGGPYPSHRVDLCDTMIAVKVDYSLVSTVAVASSTSTAITATSAVAGEDSAFVYFNAGTGIGQLGFLKSTATDTYTLTSALTTTADSSTKITKVLPLFASLVIWKVNSTTQPTTLDSTVGLGSARAGVLANWISKNGLISRLDPLIHHNTQGLNTANQFALSSYVGIQNSLLHPID